MNRTTLAAALAAVVAVASAASAQPSAPAQGQAQPPARGAGQGRGQNPQANAPQPNWKPMAYDARGPMKVKTESVAAVACTIFRPESLGAGGWAHPIVLWGNGTGQTPATYAPMLENLASWGFVVAAANTTNAGTSIEMLKCLDWLTAENGRAGSPYKDNLDLDHVGASGHSQGGGGSLMAGRDPRVRSVAAVEPWTSSLNYVMGAETRQHGPVLMLSGGNDQLAVPARQQQPVFDNINTPLFWATLKDASHYVPMRGGGVFTGAVTAWFRYTLMGDPKAAALFRGPDCGYCKAADWTVKYRNQDAFALH